MKNTNNPTILKFNSKDNVVAVAENCGNIEYGINVDEVNLSDLITPVEIAFSPQAEEIVSSLDNKGFLTYKINKDLLDVWWKQYLKDSYADATKIDRTRFIILVARHLLGENGSKCGNSYNPGQQTPNNALELVNYSIVVNASDPNFVYITILKASGC